MVVAARPPGHPAIADFLDAHGYTRAGADSDLARASRMLTVITAAIAAVGAVITILALGILILSLDLLVQKNRRTISGLLMLGYTPAQVSRRYITLVIVINGSVLILAAAALLQLRRLWESPLGAFGITTASPWCALLTATLLIAAVTALNATIITRLVRRCFRP